MHDGYIAFASSAVRRMTDSHKDSVSLWNLLTDLKKPECLSLLSRDSFFALYSDLRHYGVHLTLNQVYSRISDGECDLTVLTIDEHLSKLKAATDPVRHLVNKAIAHSDNKVFPQTTYQEIDAAIETAAWIIDMYSWLLRGRGIQEDLAKVQNDSDVREHIAKIWP